MTYNVFGGTLSLAQSIFCVSSPNSIALQSPYVTVVEDISIMSAKYGLPFIFGQNWPAQQSHGLFATAELHVFSSLAISLGPESVLFLGRNCAFWFSYADCCCSKSGEHLHFRSRP